MRLGVSDSNAIFAKKQHQVKREIGLSAATFQALASVWRLKIHHLLRNHHTQ